MGILLDSFWMRHHDIDAGGRKDAVLLALTPQRLPIVLFTILRFLLWRGIAIERGLNNYFRKLLGLDEGNPLSQSPDTQRSVQRHECWFLSVVFGWFLDR
jgi:hypothetical protein